jgi:hypothetical protein
MTSRFGVMSLIPDRDPAIPVILDQDGEFLAWAFEVHQPAALDLLGVRQGQCPTPVLAVFNDPLMGNRLRLARGHGRDAATQAA